MTGVTKGQLTLILPGSDYASARGSGANQARTSVWAGEIERHEALTNLAVVKGHCLRHVAACQKKLRAAGAGERW